MKEKILVVDDEPLILNTINRALTKNNYRVRITEDAESFLAELNREPADLLIMDINLGGISSESLVENINDIAPGSSILFISGVMPEAEVEHFLEKPFDIDTLRQKVRQILGRNRK